ncbi:hypothetical protein NL676_034121 [Syzygium grande]|nr:hypothetical protein NL676_034121 [Syzygium grande]
MEGEEGAGEGSAPVIRAARPTTSIHCPYHLRPPPASMYGSCHTLLETNSRSALPLDPLLLGMSLERDCWPCAAARGGDSVVVVLVGIDTSLVISCWVLCHPDFPISIAKHVELKVPVLDGASPILIGSQGRNEEDEDLPDKRSEEPAESDGEDAAADANGWITASNDVDMENQIILAEDKKHYPTAEEVYGEDVETRVMYEDEQPLEQPIIEPVWNIKFEVGVKDSCTHASTQFLIGLMSNPALVWNVALVGHLRHGKTVFMDMLVEQTRHISTFDVNNEKHMRYTDTRIDEQERRISIKAIPMSLVLEDSNSKSYLCNITDTPGHVNFSDEMTAALRLADGAALIVDAAEGVMVIILSFLL